MANETSVAAIKSALTVIVAVADTIREVGEVPSGYLYSSLMASMPGLTFNGYQSIIASLKGAGLVTETAHLLRWSGPAIPKSAEAGKQ